MTGTGTEMLCLSGAALGAIFGKLFFERQEPKVDPEHLMLMAQLQAQLKVQPKNLALASNKATRTAPTAPKQDAQAKDAELSLQVGSWEGFSMEDARKRSEALKGSFQEASPPEVLSSLQRGNARFWTGKAVRPEKSAFERRALIIAQFPSVAVLGCADSRVPVEVVFDQGLGDMFVVRVAGNCLDTSTSASLQYAVHHLKVKVLMVMGHEGCGAVKAAGLPIEQIEQEPHELATALKGMKEGLNEHRLNSIDDSRCRDREAVVTNVRRQVELLCEDDSLLEKVEKKELMIVGCFYEISSGIVDFLMEVSEMPYGKVKPQMVKEGASDGVQSRLEYKKDALPSSGKSKTELPDPDALPCKEDSLEIGMKFMGFGSHILNKGLQAYRADM